MDEEIFEIIKKTRKTAKMTQEEVASATGLSRITVGKIENASIADVTFSNIDRVLEALDLELTVRPRGRPPTLDELSEKKKSK